MIRADEKRSSPEVRAPVAHDLYQADELPLVGRELVMARGERPAEESERACALMKDGAEPHAGGVAVHREQLVEVRHMEDRSRGESLLEALENLSRLGVPGEGAAMRPNARMNLR